MRSVQEDSSGCRSMSSLRDSYSVFSWAGFFRSCPVRPATFQGPGANRGCRQVVHGFSHRRHQPWLLVWILDFRFASVMFLFDVDGIRLLKMHETPYFELRAVAPVLQYDLSPLYWGPGAAQRFRFSHVVPAMHRSKLELHQMEAIEMFRIVTDFATSLADLLPITIRPGEANGRRWTRKVVTSLSCIVFSLLFMCMNLARAQQVYPPGTFNIDGFWVNCGPVYTIVTPMIPGIAMARPGKYSFIQFLEPIRPG